MRKFWKISGIIAAVVLVLLIGAFFYVSSGFFVKTHVLPQVAAKLGEPVAVDDVSFSMFSSIELTGLTVGQADSPMVKAKTIRAKYRAFSALSGKIVVDEVLVDQLAVDISAKQIAAIQQRLQSESSPSDSADDSSSGSGDIDLDIKNINVQSLQATYRQGEQKVEIRDLNVSLPAFKLGEPFAVDFSTAATLTTPDATLTVNELTTAISGTVSKDLKPVDVKLEGHVKLKAQAGEVVVPELAYKYLVSAVPDGQDVGAKFELSSLGGGAPAELVTVDTQVNLETLSGKADLVVALSRPDLLNLVGSVVGDYDFGRTAVNYFGKVTFKDAGKSAGLDGKLSIENFTVASKELKLEPLEPLMITSEHVVSAEPEAKTFGLEKLVASVTAASKQVVSVSLDQPTSVTLNADGSIKADDATLTIETKELDLSIARPFIPPSDAFAFLGGSLSDTIVVKITEAGKNIQVTGDLALSKLAIRAQDEEIRDIAVNARFGGGAELTKSARIDLVNVVVTQGSAEWVKVALQQPMTLSLDKGASADIPDAALVIESTGLDLAIAKPFIPPSDAFAFQGGKLVQEINLIVKNGGKNVEASGRVHLQQLAAKVMDGELKNMSVQTDFVVLASLAEAPDVTVKSLNVTAADSVSTWAKVALTKPLQVTLAESGPAQTGQAQFTVATQSLALDTFTKLVKLPDGLQLSPGSLQYAFTVGVGEMGDSLRLAGAAKTRGLDVTQGTMNLAQIGTTIDLDVSVTKKSSVVVRQARLLAVQGQDATQLLEATVGGSVNLDPMSGQLDVELLPVTRDGMALAGRLAGGLELGKTTPSYKGKVMLGTDTISSQGALTVRDFTASMPDLKLSDLSPIQISASYDISMNTSQQQLAVKAFSAKMTDATGMLVDAKVDQPSTIDLGSKRAVGKALGLAVDVSGVNLQSFAAVAQQTAGIHNLQGQFGAALKTRIGIDKQAHTSTVRVDLANFAMRKPGSGTLQPVGMSSTMAMTCEADGTAAVDKMQVFLLQGTTPLLKLDIDAQLDARMQGGKSTITVASTQPVDAGKLQKLWVKEEPLEPAPAPAPAPGPAEAEPPPDFSKIWVEARLQFPQIIYDTIDLSGLNMTAEFKAGKLTIPINTFSLNGNTGSLQALADINNPQIPIYDATLKLSKLDLAVAKPFVGKYLPVEMSGAVSDINAHLAGSGTSKDDILNNLDLQMKSSLDQIVFAKPEFNNSLGQVGGLVSGFLSGEDKQKAETYALYLSMAAELQKAFSQGNTLDGVLAANRVWLPLALESKVFPQYNMAWSDLSFTQGNLDLDFSKGILSVPKLSLSSPDMRVALDGQWNILANEIPDFHLQPAVKGRLAPKAADKTADSDGYYLGESYKSKELIGSLLSKNGMSSMFGGGGSPIPTSKEEIKGAITKGLLDAIGGKKDKADGKTDAKPDAKDQQKEAAKKLIEGFFK